SGCSSAPVAWPTACGTVASTPASTRTSTARTRPRSATGAGRRDAEAVPLGSDLVRDVVAGLVASEPGPFGDRVEAEVLERVAVLAVGPLRASGQVVVDGRPEALRRFAVEALVGVEHGGGGLGQEIGIADVDELGVGELARRTR